ncbi:MAG: polysaccharide biosynthesis tyrosine autokinase [Gemmataceae bacterium]|nr:polysaccharide biosynthesis tyrosine autokinase [Gemmataceae bacterium]
MDNGNKNSEIPSALETTMVRPSALYASPAATTTVGPLAPVPVQAVPAQAASTPAEPPGLATAPTMTALMQALRRRWLTAVAAAVAAAILAVAAVFFVMPPRYLVEARLLVKQRTPGGLTLDHREDTEFNVYKGNLQSMIKAPLNLSSAFNQKTSDGKLVRDLGVVRGMGGGVEWLDKAIKTDYNLGPEILKVTLSADRADEAAELLNAVVTAFLYDLEQKEKVRAEDLVEQLLRKRRDLEKELGQLRAQLVIKEQVHKVPNLAEQGKKLEIGMAELAALRRELTKNLLDKIDSKQQLDNLVDRQKNLGAVPVPDDELTVYLRNDPRAQQLYLDWAKADKDFQEAVRNSTNPVSAEPYRDKRDRLKRLLDEQREELRPDLEKQWRLKFSQDLRTAELALGDRIKGLNKQEGLLHELERKARDEVERLMPGPQNVPSDVLSLRDNISSMERAIGKIGEDITVLRANPAKTRVELLQRATPPQDRDMSRQAKFAGAGGIGVFGLALLGVAFLEFRRRKVGGAEDVVRGLGIAVVGTVPTMPGPARKPLSGGASQLDVYWQNRLMESIDGIRTMLLHTSRNDSLRVIMVTSAVGGEGKTSVASQLAASLARAWKRTLLIDGDLRNPAAHRLFNVSQDPGFSEVLRAEAEPAQAIRATPISRLWVLPAGNWDAHAVQALAQDQVRSLFQALKAQYDFIIVDSCPVLPVADSLLLSQHTDGVLFSVMRDVSRLPAVWAAQQRLQNLGVRTLGAVVIGDRGDDLGAADYRYAVAKAGK